MILDKLKLPLIIIGLILVLVIVLQIRSCVNERRITDISELEGRYKAFTEEAEKEKEELQQQKKEVEKQIEILKGAVLDLTEKTKEYKEQIKTKDNELRDLKTQFSLIDEEDKDGQILNLKAQVGNLETQLSKAMEGWDAAEAKAVGWKKALDLKDEYCKKLEKQIGIKDNLIKISESVNRDKDKKIASLKLGKTIERIITWPLAGYGAFKFVQGVFFK